MTDSHIDSFVRKLECETSGMYFNRFFFKHRFGSKMIVNEHHKVMQRALDRTMLPPNDPDFIPRLIINVPPGFTKTDMACISYMARGLGINGGARFLHLSYSDALCLLNSSTTRQIVRSDDFQKMWPVVIKDDTDSKKMWHTDQQGGVTATSAGGQVTGFRAGHMDTTKFTGALLIDDPVKPDDAYSEVKRKAVNNGYNETIASRLAIQTIPIIVIMQRIHHDDLSGHLLRGGSGEKWHHLNLPVIINNNTDYPKEYTHGMPADHGLNDGWLWPFKLNESHETALRSHRRKFAAQYMQNPIKRDEETALWPESVISKTHDGEFDGKVRTFVSVDPAVSNNKTSDEHGIIVGTKNGDDEFTVEGDYTMRGSPVDWATRAIWAYQHHDADAIVIEVNQGGDMCEQTLRNARFTGSIIKVHASKGKTARSEPIAALYEQGFVKHKNGLLLLEDELMDFDPITGKSAGKSPNRVDALVWLITELNQDNSRELLELAMNRT